jgi:hypothetical protein
MAAQARQGMHIALHVFDENSKLKSFLCYCNFLSYFVIFQVLTMRYFYYASCQRIVLWLLLWIYGHCRTFGYSYGLVILYILHFHCTNFFTMNTKVQIPGYTTNQGHSPSLLPLAWVYASWLPLPMVPPSSSHLPPSLLILPQIHMVI